MRKIAPALPRALCALALIALAACAPPRAAPPAQAGAGETRASVETDRRSAFQKTLDRHGVALTLPETGKAILVNVPAFQLIAFEDAAPVIRSRVIVGSTRNPTPLMDTYASAVRFRPSWRPTPDMVRSGEYPDRRWPPGPRNPLGLAAIRLEPGLLVYLHDTNRRSLFGEEMRALSHGCIRVERWDEVIAWLLEIDLDEVRRHAGGRRTFDMPTPPVPVLIRYYTAFPADDGTLERFDDIYGLEPGPVAALDAAAAEACGPAGPANLAPPPVRSMARPQADPGASGLPARRAVVGDGELHAGKQRVEIGPRRRSVRDGDDMRPSVRADREEAGLGEAAVGFGLGQRVGDIEAEPAHLRLGHRVGDRKGPAEFGDIRLGLFGGVARGGDDVEARLLPCRFHRLELVEILLAERAVPAAIDDE